MTTKTLANLRDEMSLEAGDYLHSTATTAINADNLLVDTALADVHGGYTDGYFKDWWVLITSNANEGAIRRVANYTTFNQTLHTSGTAFADDSTNLATYELHRFHPTTKLNAINITARKLYPKIHRVITDNSIITGNILPDFNWWTSSSANKFWAASSTTLARTSPSSTTGLSRDQRFSMKSTVSSANGYAYINAKIYPRLLDLQDHFISIYVWVYPQAADDVFIDFYTKTIAGTEATESSTTTTYAGKWQPIKIEDYDVPDNLEQVELRIRVATNGNYTYISQPRIVGREIHEYMLPELLQDGAINWVRWQMGGSDNFKPADDVGFDEYYLDLTGWGIVSRDVNGTNYKYITVPFSLSKDYHLKMEGIIPLEDNLSADTDTLTIDDPYTQLFVLEATRQMFKMMRGKASSLSSDEYEKEIARLDYELSRLSNLAMGRPASQMRFR